MMRISKNIFVVALGLSYLFMFTGCMAKVFVDPSIGSEKSVRGDVSGKMIYVEGKESWRSPSAGYNVKTRNIHVLQNAADATLKEGYMYFAIARPLEVSTLEKQIVMNTPQEFIEKCTPMGEQIFNIGNRRCGFDGEKVWAAVLIIAFKEKPLTFLVYDAKEVMDYLKENSLLREDSYEVRINNDFLHTFPDALSIMK